MSDIRVGGGAEEKRGKAVLWNPATGGGGLLLYCWVWFPRPQSGHTLGSKISILLKWTLWQNAPTKQLLFSKRDSLNQTLKWAQERDIWGDIEDMKQEGAQEPCAMEEDTVA